MNAMKTIVQRLPTFSKKKEPSACLLAIAGAARPGEWFKLERQETVIGRADDADIVVDDETISRRHARLELRQDGSWHLVDLGSTNGTFMNGNKVGDSTLSDGDQIQLGPSVVLRFGFQDSLDEALQRNLQEAATRDLLTRAYTRGFLLDAVEKEIAFGQRHQIDSSLLLFAIDSYVELKERLSAQEFDGVLIRLAASLMTAVRTEDIVARCGADCFGVLLRGAARSEAFEVAERLRVMVDTTNFRDGGEGLRISVTGVLRSLSPKGGEVLGGEAMLALLQERLVRTEGERGNKILDPPDDGA